ncbi:hypothetical protein LR48_Vigan01g049000 [Vigna angularis]|uniref:Uncharacterized protein n=1 Tax=Phaseolus angularis TaxID=3914 RepID=A0A0L9TK44_PHAAN|nr:hypothetical protein LR48_Vigan01g049000 [Vigna angularis]
MHPDTMNLHTEIIYPFLLLLGERDCGGGVSLHRVSCGGGVSRCGGRLCWVERCKWGQGTAVVRARVCGGAYRSSKGRELRLRCNPPAQVPINLDIDEHWGEQMIREMMCNEMQHYHPEAASANA